MLLLFVREGLSLARYREECIPALPAAAANPERFTVIPVPPAAHTTL